MVEQNTEAYLFSNCHPNFSCTVYKDALWGCATSPNTCFSCSRTFESLCIVSRRKPTFKAGEEHDEGPGTAQFMCGNLKAGVLSASIGCMAQENLSNRNGRSPTYLLRSVLRRESCRPGREGSLIRYPELNSYKCLVRCTPLLLGWRRQRWDDPRRTLTMNLLELMNSRFNCLKIWWRMINEDT